MTGCPKECREECPVFTARPSIEKAGRAIRAFQLARENITNISSMAPVKEGIRLFVASITRRFLRAKYRECQHIRLS